MKRFILKLLFNNYERGLIKCALSHYSNCLYNTASETASEDGYSVGVLASSFEFKRVDPVWPLVPTNYQLEEARRLVSYYKDKCNTLAWEATVV